MGQSFKEFEHKFIVSEGFDRAKFFADVGKLGPAQTYQVSVEDMYFLLKERPNSIFRHRYDEKIQQLTLKSIETSAFERTEINLNLSHPNQRDAVEHFLTQLGTIVWSKGLMKDVAVAEFSDCEIVHYHASCGAKKISCVEFEATKAKNRVEALSVLSHYEKTLGFDGQPAESKSLFELLALEQAPEQVVQFFTKKTAK